MLAASRARASYWEDSESRGQRRPTSGFSSVGFIEMMDGFKVGGGPAKGSEADNTRIHRFRRDVEQLRAHLTETRRGFINPRSVYQAYWDGITTLALAYTATVTPFEVGLGLETKLNVLFYMNTAINIIFVMDIIWQFFLPVPDKEGNLVRSHYKIACKYLRGWFAMDLFTVLPFDSLQLMGALPTVEGACGDSTGMLLKAVRIVRVARLLKLLRVLRASRIVTRWQSQLNFSSTTQSLFTAWFAFIILVHWLACLWALMPQLQNSWRDEPLVIAALEERVLRDPTCDACLCAGDRASEACSSPCLTPCEIEVAANVTHSNEAHVHMMESWMCRASTDGLLPSDFVDKPYTVWLSALMLALMAMLGGTSVVYPTNDYEYSFFMVIFIIAAFAFAWVQGVIISALTTGNPDAIAFRTNLDALNYMMDDQFFPPALKSRVREFYLRTRTMAKRQRYIDLIDSTLSAQLRHDTKVTITAGIFKAVWWLQQCEHAFLEELSMQLERESFAADEYIKSLTFDGEARMYIIVSGIASRGGAFFTSGMSWGDIILASPLLRDTRPAKTLGYCEVVSLTRSGLEKVVKAFPASAGEIRLAGLKLATRRSILLVSSYIKYKKTKKASLAVEGETGGMIAGVAADEGDLDSPLDVLRQLQGDTGSILADASAELPGPSSAPPDRGPSEGDRNTRVLLEIVRGLERGQTQSTLQLKRVADGMKLLSERLERLEKHGPSSKPSSAERHGRPLSSRLSFAMLREMSTKPTRADKPRLGSLSEAEEFSRLSPKQV